MLCVDGVSVNEQKQKIMKNLEKGLFFGFVWLACIWFGIIINMFLFPINQYGIVPRDTSLMGFVGIFLHPFLHGDLGHILANSIPLFVLSVTLMSNYPRLATKIVFLSIFIGGIMIWLFGREGVHIGASGLIFSLIGFLVFNVFFRRDWRSLFVAVIIGFLYWTAIFGIFPGGDSNVSWEGHLFGFLTGIWLAYVFRESPSEWLLINIKEFFKLLFFIAWLLFCKL